MDPQTPDPGPRTPPAAVLLAAGRGTRMGGDRPKVLHEVASRPMIRWVVDACLDAGVSRIAVVVGYRGDEVRNALADEPACAFVEQAEQLGTAHAVEMARPWFEDEPADDVLVLAGDGPLIRAATLTRLLDVHRESHAAATLATAVIDDPTGYGRVLRTPRNTFDQIVEQKDATPEQLAVREVNPSYYCFDGPTLFDALPRVGNANAGGEYYLTDVPGLLEAEGRTVALVDAVPAADVLSINTPAQLAEVDRLLKQRLATIATGAST
ncbi:MAG: NTP transferase domain-containing protein [Planctomycetota bacterium]